MKTLKKTFFISVVSITALHIALLTFTEFIDWPELLLYPWLLHNGFSLYKDLPVPYQPLILITLEIIYSSLGFSVSALRTIHLAIIAITDISLVFVLYKTTKSYAASVVGLLLYSMLHVASEGNGLWFDHTAIPILALGYYFILRTVQPKSKKSYQNTFLAILFVGTALLIKQTFTWILGVLLFFPILDGLFIKSKYHTHKLFLIGAGSLLFPLFQALFFFMINRGNKYIFWVYRFGFELRNDRNYIIPPNIQGDLPLILIIVLALIVFLLALKTKAKRFNLSYSAIWFGFAMLTLFPRWSLTHFQAPLMFLAILFAHSISHLNLKKAKRAVAPTLIVLLVIMFSLRTVYGYTKKNFNKPNRFYNNRTKNLVKKIQDIKGDDPYFLFGNTEYLYAYMREVPHVKPYIQLFPWNTQIPGIQEQQLKELGAVRIKYIFYAPYHPDNVFYNGQKPEKLFSYLENNYEPSGQINEETTVYVKLQTPN